MPAAAISGTVWGLGALPGLVAIDVQQIGKCVVLRLKLGNFGGGLVSLPLALKHGGQLELHNDPQGGLSAMLVLPRRAVVKPGSA